MSIQGRIDIGALSASEYLPNKGVFLTQIVGKDSGDGFGFYRGRIEVGSGIALEVHDHCTETIYVLSGEATGLMGDQEIALSAGDAFHVQKSVPHGIKNRGDSPLEILVVGCPDF